MNKHLQTISQLSNKPERSILGLMSGTSLDGLDIALCRFSDSGLKVTHFDTAEYTEVFRERLAAIRSKESVQLAEVCLLNREIADMYANCIAQRLEKWGVPAGEIDLIASHGQTIYHLPDGSSSSTLQIGDGDNLAVQTGIPVLSNFRQKHVAAGGEGAPLAALMDERLFRHPEKNRMLLNLGGIANFTWIPSKNEGGEILTSDTGPANTLINEACEKYFNLPFDEDGKIAFGGMVHSELLKYLLLEPYFRKPLPKTTGQEEFNLDLVEALMKGYQIELKPEDLVATLTKLTVKSIERAFDQFVGEREYELFVSGGGLHNPVIMNGLEENLPLATLHQFEDLGMDPDAKEAALMAYLANEWITGNAFTVNGVKVNLGSLSLPE